MTCNQGSWLKYSMGYKCHHFFPRAACLRGPVSLLDFAQIPLKPLESLRVYQAPGSVVCKAGWRAVVRSQPGGEDSYCEGARRAGSHSATETLCLCMERCALISRLYWRHTLPVSNLYCWFSLHSCLGPSQSCCFLAFLFFLMEIRLSRCGDTRDRSFAGLIVTKGISNKILVHFITFFRKQFLNLNHMFKRHEKCSHPWTKKVFCLFSSCTAKCYKCI